MSKNTAREVRVHSTGPNDPVLALQDVDVKAFQRAYDDAKLNGRQWFHFGGHDVPTEKGPALIQAAAMMQELRGLTISDD